MGQAASYACQAGSRKARQPLTQPAAEERGQRKDYIHRLGIQRNAHSASFSPAPQINYDEDLGQYEKKGRKHSGSCIEKSSTQSVVSTTTSGPSEPSLKSTTSDESEDSSDLHMKYLDLNRQEGFRVSYLRKLSYEKVWVPASQRPPKHQTVIIFDWDDTLLCSSFLSGKDGHQLGLSTRRVLHAIETNAIRLLEMAMKLGHTFIITNAMEGWIEYSAAKYVPGLLPILQKVQLISARSRYEEQYPCEVNKWKINAFLDVQHKLDSEVITNLTSVGDSNYEMDATHIMAEKFSQALIKTIKLKENPSSEELLKQLELIVPKFEQIVDSARNMQIGLERKKY